MTDDSKIHAHLPLIELIYVGFLRIVAAAAIYCGLYYWALLIGLGASGTERFDLMSGEWRMAAPFLAVAYPVAALGLWAAASWGAAVWLAAAGAELMMNLGWPTLFGRNDILIIAYFGIIIIYAAFRLYFFYIHWQQMRSVTFDSR